MLDLQCDYADNLTINVRLGEIDYKEDQVVVPVYNGPEVECHEELYMLRYFTNHSQSHVTYLMIRPPDALTDPGTVIYNISY